MDNVFVNWLNMRKVATNFIFKLILVSLTLILASSCIITNTPGFYNGYKKLTTEEKSKVLFLNANGRLDTLKNKGQIVALSGIHLRNYAAKVDSLVVYRWGPNCSAAECISISVVEAYCTSKNYKMVVVSEYYDIPKMQVQNYGELPLLIPNHIFYKKYYADGLNDLFFKDLLNGHKLDPDDQYNRFLILNRGKVVASRRNLIDE